MTLSLHDTILHAFEALKVYGTAALPPAPTATEDSGAAYPKGRYPMTLHCPPRQAGPLRSRLRARCLRRRLRRNIKGRKSHSIVRQALTVLMQPRPPRRLRLRDEHRRRRRHPDPDPARVPEAACERRAASTCPTPASTASAWSSCPRRRVARELRRAIFDADRPPRRARRSSAGAPCRPTTDLLGPTARRGRAR